MKSLVIIPAYNEEASVIEVIKKLRKDCEEADYIVINDCSKDHTKDMLEHNHAKYISLPINMGIGGAVQTGYQYALEHGYDIAIQIDGDGQHDTKFLRDIIGEIEAGNAHVVIGSRFIKKEGFQSSGIRRMGIGFLSNLIKVCTGLRIYDVTSGFRAVNRDIIEIFAKDYPSDYPEPEAIVMVASKGYQIKEVPVIMKERSAGVSSISPTQSIYYMIKVSIAIVLSRLINRKG